jgi:hypothetical protein
MKRPLARLWGSEGRSMLAIAGVALIAWLVGWVLARYAPADADFSISARSEVLTLEVACNQHLSWDLPPGRFKVADGETQTASKVLGVKLRGGARARLRLGRDEQWQARFDRSPQLDCAADAGDLIVVSADGQALPPSPQGLVYESLQPMREAPRPTLLLQGRVVLGEEIQAGIGSSQQLLVAPMLRRAHIQVRALDDPLGQRRLIHEEAVDAGGIVDSHGCLDVPDRAPDHPGEDVLASCVRKPGWNSQGFIHVGAGDGEPGFDVRLQVTGHHVGVRQQGGAERRILVSWWSRVVSSPSVQISVAFVFALANVGLLGYLMAAARRREPEAEDKT